MNFYMLILDEVVRDERLCAPEFSWLFLFFFPSFFFLISAAGKAQKD